MLGEKYFLKHEVHCIWDSQNWDSERLDEITFVTREFLNSISINSRAYLFQTSGTTSQPKFIIHTQDTLMACAQGCKEWLGLTPSDRWMNVLSGFHMGGFSTYFRTDVLNLQPVRTALWDLHTLKEEFEAHKCSLISLVPTQIYQIVEASLSAPKGLRLTLVGGGALDTELQNKANALGWKVLRSLGSTETGSQIFTERLNQPTSGAWALPHFDVRVDNNSVLQVKGEGVFKGYIVETKNGYKVIPTVLDAHGFWTSSDRVELAGRKVEKFLGRATDQVKILGHLVDMNQIRKKWTKFLETQSCDFEAHLEVLPDTKSEHQMVLWVENLDDSWETKIQVWNQSVSVAERIRGWYYVRQIPKSNIGKTQSYQIKRLFSE